MTDQYQRLRRDGLGWIGDLFKGLERRVKSLEGLSPDQLGGTRQQIVVVDQKADTAAADALEAAANALAAQSEALQAALDAANAQADANQANARTPGNLFDDAPIRTQNRDAWWYLPTNSADVTLSFLSDGVELQTTSGGGFFVFGNLQPVPITDVIKFAANFLLELPDGPLPSGDYGVESIARRVTASGADASLGFGTGLNKVQGWANPTFDAVGSVAYGSGSSADPTVAIRPVLVVYFPPTPGYRIRVRQPFTRLVSGTVDIGAATVQTGNIAPGSIVLSKLDSYIAARIPRAGLFVVENPTSDTSQWPIATNGVYTELPIPTATGVTTTNTANDGAAATLATAPSPVVGNYFVAPFTGIYQVAAIVRFDTRTNNSVRAAGFRVSATGASTAQIRKLKVDRRQANTFPAAPVSVDPSGLLPATAGDRIWVAATHDGGADIRVKLEDFSIRYLGT